MNTTASTQPNEMIVYRSEDQAPASVPRHVPGDADAGAAEATPAGPPPGKSGDVCPVCRGPERVELVRAGRSRRVRTALVAGWKQLYTGPRGHRMVFQLPGGPRDLAGEEVCWDCWCAESKARWGGVLPREALLWPRVGVARRRRRAAGRLKAG